MDHPHLDPTDHSSLFPPLSSWLPFSTSTTPRVRTPPFFVAMPRGMPSHEAMSIQHSYDLFSGAAGQMQVKTANDRKAVVGGYDQHKA